ncbi:MAG: hypothetical protein AB7P03_04720 [Kofleriaceae bacterium]
MTGANDTCASAAEIDLSTGVARFTFTTQGATSNFPENPCCNTPGFADVVIRLRNPTTSAIELSCPSLDGTFFSYMMHDGGACPMPDDVTSPSCAGTSCTLSSQSNDGIADGHMIVFCRDSSLGPVTVEIRNL